MATDKQFEALRERVDTAIRLLAYQIVADKNVSQGAPILKRLGLSLSDIADIYDSTTGSISVRLAESRRPKAKGNPKRK